MATRSRSNSTTFVGRPMPLRVGGAPERGQGRAMKARDAQKSATAASIPTFLECWRPNKPPPATQLNPKKYYPYEIHITSPFARRTAQLHLRTGPPHGRRL